MDLFKENEEPEIESKRVDPETGISIKSEKLNGINLNNLNDERIKSKSVKAPSEHQDFEASEEDELDTINEELSAEIQEILFTMDLDSLNEFLENDLS